MRTKEPRAQVKRRILSALSARSCRFLQMNLWGIFLFLGVLCLFGAYGIISLAERRTIGEVDRKFLDEVVQQQSHDADTLSVPERNKGTASEIPLGHPALLRAELVVNSAIVRRAELVVRSGIGKRSRTNMTTTRENSQTAAESGRRLN